VANERLADLTQADLIEIGNQDPRAKLLERLYADPDAKADILKHSKRLHPKAAIPEFDVPEAARAAIKDDVDFVKKGKEEIEEFRKERRHERFRADLVKAGAQEEDLDKIETFMVDNEIGPKSLGLAVEKYYATLAPAEPNFESEHTFTMPDAGSEHIKKLMAAGPGEDLDAINMPYVEKLFREMGQGRRA